MTLQLQLLLFVWISANDDSEQTANGKPHKCWWKVRESLQNADNLGLGNIPGQWWHACYTSGYTKPLWNIQGENKQAVKCIRLKNALPSLKLTAKAPANWWLEDDPVLLGPSAYVHVSFGEGVYMGVSENSGTPKSSILIGFSTINYPFWGTSIFGNIQMVVSKIVELNSSPNSWVEFFFDSHKRTTKDDWTHIFFQVL